MSQEDATKFPDLVSESASNLTPEHSTTATLILPPLYSTGDSSISGTCSLAVKSLTVSVTYFFSTLLSLNTSQTSSPSLTFTISLLHPWLLHPDITKHFCKYCNNITHVSPYYVCITLFSQ